MGFDRGRDRRRWARGSSPQRAAWKNWRWRARGAPTSWARVAARNETAVDRRTGCVYNSGEAPANPRPVQQCPPALTMMVGRNDHGRLSSRSDPVRPLHPLPLVDVHRTWIAERIGTTDVCVTSDIPLASRWLKKGARVVSATGKHWTEANIGNALAGRDIARHLRELGEITRGPAPLTKQDRSRFLNALDTAVQAALREASHS